MATTYDKFIGTQAAVLRKDDKPPASRKEWEARRTELRTSMLKAMGSLPEKPCALEPKVVDTLSRKGYHIEKLLFQSQPDVWVTANAYVSESVKGKTFRTSWEDPDAHLSISPLK
jgi:hypothetical protein